MNEGPYRGAGTTDPDEPAEHPSKPWALQTWVSRRACPQCAVALFAARKEGFRIDACATCGGAWLDHRTAERAIAQSDLTPALLAEQAARHAGRVDSSAKRACPICHEPLRQRLVPEARVVIDACHAHGFWFDPDEMRVVIECLARAQAAPVDPSVDEAIAREARLGRFRPPENDDPHRAGLGAILGGLVELLLPPRDKS